MRPEVMNGDFFTTQYLHTNWKWILAPLLMTFASSFGQTFFFGIFGEPIRAEFNLSHYAWGSLYAIGTLTSAACLLTFGSIVDRTPPRKLLTIIMLAYVAFCMFMAINPFALLLPLAIFGLRFCGQGMLSHMAMVFAGKWFVATRGKVVAIATLGFGLGEITFPYSFSKLLLVADWRIAWCLAAILIIGFWLIITPLLKTTRKPSLEENKSQKLGMLSKNWTQREMLNHWVFWAVFPSLLMIPIFSTALFFQISVLANEKSWTLIDLTARVPLYTAGGLAGLVFAGWLIDKIGTRRMMALYLIPATLGFVILSHADSLIFGTIGLTLVGASIGMSGPYRGSFWAEFYGTKHLGAINAVAASTMVFATALGPLVTGWLLDHGITFDQQLLIMGNICGLAATTLLGVSYFSRRLFLTP